MTNIGFVGLGDQGGPMARRIVDSGVPTTLWARRPASLEPFADTAATIASTPAELGERSDIVCVCVVDDAGTEEVVAGPDGVLKGMASGGIVAIHSTVHPDTCHRLAALAAARGVAIVDAPVSGGGEKAAAKELLVIVGGEEDDVARCRPTFETFGNPVIHVGPLGTGQIAKLVNNLLMAAHLGVAEQALDAGVELGLERRALGEVLQHGSGSSFSLGALVRFGSMDAFKDRAGPLLRKDVSILDGMLQGIGVDATASLRVADVALVAMGYERRSAEASSFG